MTIGSDLDAKLGAIDDALEAQVTVNNAQAEVNAAVEARLDALEQGEVEPPPPPTPETGPTITTGPSVIGLTQTSATVRWTMSEVCSGQIEWGTTPALGLVTAFQGIDGGYSTHIQSIDGLSPGTTYHYRTVSTDADGVTVYSPVLGFTTDPASGSGGSPGGSGDGGSPGRFPASRPALTFVDWTGPGDIAEPGHLEWVKDPHFDTLVTRITADGGEWRPNYPKKPAWNATMERMWLNRGGKRLLDGRTFEDLGVASDGNSRLTWSAVDPHLAFQTSAGDNRLYTIDPGISGRVAIATFPMVSDVSNSDEGRQSLDDRYVALECDWTGSGFKKLLIYDTVADDIVAGPVVLPAYGDAAGMSPSGEFVYVHYKAGGFGTGQGIWVLDQKLEHLHGKAILSGGHSDTMRDADLSDVFVGYDGNSYAKVDMATGVKTTVQAPALGGHISGVAFGRPGWAYLSNHYQYYGKAGWDQIWALKLDGSGEVHPFGNARTVQRTKGQSPGGYIYQLSTHAVPSPDGEMVAWGGGYRRWVTDETTAHAYVARAA